MKIEEIEKINCESCGDRKAEYKCEDCDTPYCGECAEWSYYKCDECEPPRLIKITTKHK